MMKIFTNDRLQQMSSYNKLTSMIMFHWQQVPRYVATGRYSEFMVLWVVVPCNVVVGGVSEDSTVPSSELKCVVTGK
jgi:hypothetical protein